MDKIILERPKKHSRKRSIFPLIYMLFCLVLVTLIAFALNYLKKYLENYEKTRPIYVAEEYMKTVQQDVRGFLKNKIKIEKGEYETEENFNEFLSSIISSGELSFGQKSGEFNEDAPVYVVAVGRRELASIYLSSSEVDEFDNKIWQISEVKTSSFSSDKYMIIAPSSTKVFVNGKEIPSEKMANSEQKLSFPIAYNDEFAVPFMKEIIIEGMYKKPQVEVVDDLGNPIEIVFDDERNTFTASFLSNDAVSEGLFDYIFNIFALYGDFTMQVVNFSAVSPYIDNESHLYKNMPNMERWNFPPNGIYYENQVMWDTYSYGLDKFSCKIYADQYVDVGYRKSHSPVMYEVFMKKKNGKWFLTDMRFLTNNDLPENLKKSIEHES